jgi:hypothetical protein
VICVYMQFVQFVSSMAFIFIFLILSLGLVKLGHFWQIHQFEYLNMFMHSVHFIIFVYVLKKLYNKLFFINNFKLTVIK